MTSLTTNSHLLNLVQEKLKSKSSKALTFFQLIRKYGHLDGDELRVSYNKLKSSYLIRGFEDLDSLCNEIFSEAKITDSTEKSCMGVRIFHAYVIERGDLGDPSNVSFYLYDRAISVIQEWGENFTDPVKEVVKEALV